ncbi:type II secretion system protein [Spirulina sp. CS-785/01]|uniref:pilus assembly FimT family protein n=1 Tax=Spirulina sp. CS-785/01 TaxID=3021716 RepID=UPI00232E4902|nr:type II secretion system protein [Spirulina sp. CS-785/01]MDB9313687.1 type II secretion system protein [Spirulina sp. CS-785/01]
MSKPWKNEQGFTLLELLVGLVIIGILAAIFIPTWLGFLQRQRLNKANSRIWQGMEKTKQKAVTNQRDWQLSFRQEGEKRGEWAIHPSVKGDFVPDHVNWQPLEEGIIFDIENSSFEQEETGEITEWRVIFNHYGCPVFRPGNACTQTSFWALGTVTVRPRNDDTLKRCVIISTLLGSMRKAEGQNTPNNKDRYCY